MWLPSLLSIVRSFVEVPPTQSAQQPMVAVPVASSTAQISSVPGAQPAVIVPQGQVQQQNTTAAETAPLTPVAPVAANATAAPNVTSAQNMSSTPVAPVVAAPQRPQMGNATMPECAVTNQVCFVLSALPSICASTYTDFARLNTSIVALTAPAAQNASAPANGTAAETSPTSPPSSLAAPQAQSANINALQVQGQYFAAERRFSQQLAGQTVKPQCYSPQTHICLNNLFLCPLAAPMQCGGLCYAQAKHTCSNHFTLVRRGDNRTIRHTHARAPGEGLRGQTHDAGARASHTTGRMRRQVDPRQTSPRMRVAATASLARESSCHRVRRAVSRAPPSFLAIGSECMRAPSVAPLPLSAPLAVRSPFA
jgi:hypothetical protein